MNNLDDTQKKTDDEVDVEVWNVLNAMKHSDSSYSMEESREIVYDKVNRKIDSDPYIIRFRRKRMIRYVSVASAVTLLVVSLSMFIYKMGFNSAFDRIAQMNVEIKAPLGTKSCITLPDGTLVTLNAGSKLVYPVSFAEERHVTLSGEGFFDVSKDSDHPFFVHSERLSVKVLGTRFNLKAYKEDKQTLLTLQSGSVAAYPNECRKDGCVFLKPDEQLIVDNATAEFQCKSVSAEKYISWVDNILVFQNQTIEEIAVILERHFGIKIDVITEKIGQEHYTAQFKHGESLEEILRMLSYNRQWKFEKCDDKIEIKSK